MSSIAVAGASSVSESAPQAWPAACTSSGRMRLPPSRTAWRMPSARRGSGLAGNASAVSSAASMRVRQASSSGPVSGPCDSDIVGQAGERFGLFGLFRVAEQLHPQLGLLQRLLAAAVQAHALLVGGQRLFKAQLAALHVVDQGLKLFERLLEVGDGRGFGGAFFDHGASLSDD